MRILRLWGKKKKFHIFFSISSSQTRSRFWLLRDKKRDALFWFLEPIVGFSPIKHIVTYLYHFFQLFTVALLFFIHFQRFLTAVNRFARDEIWVYLSGMVFTFPVSLLAYRGFFNGRIFAERFKNELITNLLLLHDQFAICVYNV